MAANITEQDRELDIMFSRWKYTISPMKDFCQKKKKEGGLPWWRSC